MDPPPAAGKIARMQMPDALEVKLKRVSHAFWQHRHPFAHPFAVAHGDLAIADIDILDAEPKAFEQPQSAPVEKFAHQLIRAPELIEDGPRFSSGKDDRDFRGTFYALNVVEKAEFSPQNFLIEKAAPRGLGSEWKLRRIFLRPSWSGRRRSRSHPFQPGAVSGGRG